SNTLPLPVSFTILKKLFACVFCDMVYHPPCPGVKPVGSVPKLPMLKLSKFSVYKTWLCMLLENSTVVKISKHFFIIVLLLLNQLFNRCTFIGLQLQHIGTVCQVFYV